MTDDEILALPPGHEAYRARPCTDGEPLDCTCPTLALIGHHLKEAPDWATVADVVGAAVHTRALHITLSEFPRDTALSAKRWGDTFPDALRTAFLEACALAPLAARLAWLGNRLTYDQIREAGPSLLSEEERLHAEGGFGDWLEHFARSGKYANESREQWEQSRLWRYVWDHGDAVAWMWCRPMAGEEWEQLCGKVSDLASGRHRKRTKKPTVRPTEDDVLSAWGEAVTRIKPLLFKGRSGFAIGPRQLGERVAESVRPEGSMASLDAPRNDDGRGSTLAETLAGAEDPRRSNEIIEAAAIDDLDRRNLELIRGGHRNRSERARILGCDEKTLRKREAKYPRRLGA